MALEDYLHKLGQPERAAERGEFTVSAERARSLLAGKALSDVWMAWLCLAQGFFSNQAVSMQLVWTSQAVRWQVDFGRTLDLEDLLRDDRFLLGWLNLGWFGTPHWDAEQSVLTVFWQGSAWKRYRFCSVLPKTLSKALRYASVPVRIGAHTYGAGYLPGQDPISLYPLPRGRRAGMQFRDAQADLSSFNERRRFALPDSDESDPDFSASVLAAFACRTKNSWSEVTWVSQGVVIAKERNTLERPGVVLVASVEALGLKTDLSGFQVINDPAYHRFVAALKRDVLWML